MSPSRYSPRDAWVRGAALLLAGAVMSSAQVTVSVVGASAIASVAGAGLLGTGAIVFALGARAGGSVTARRPVATIALIAFGVLLPIGALIPVTMSLLPGLTPSETGPFAVVANVVMIAQLACVAVAVAGIGRAGVVPAPWNWAPAWVIAGTLVMPVLFQFGVVVANPVDASLLEVASLLGAIVVTGAPVFLGAVALTLAPRVSANVAVFPPSRPGRPER